MDMLFIKTERKSIAFITKIFEAMGHLAVVTTIDRKEGLLRILYGEGCKLEVIEILKGLPCEIIES